MKYIRRLTPFGYERLMGLPDGWTAFGNAIALPCAEYIMAGIAEVL